MSEVIKIKMVDPPSGWRYGFPKPMPEDLNSEQERVQWFLDNGYPQSLIDDGMLKYVRTWFIDDKEAI
jgi:hypothetical protein